MPKPPKPAMRWGVYNKRGVLICVFNMRKYAKEITVEQKGESFRRVMVTPIATKGER